MAPRVSCVKSSCGLSDFNFHRVSIQAVVATALRADLACLAEENFRLMLDLCGG